MGVSEKPGLLDNRLWAGKAFDGAWSTALSTARDALEPATGQVFSRVGIASAADMQAAIGRAGPGPGAAQHAGAPVDCAARAARRGGRDLAVQLPAHPGPALGGSGAGAGQRGGAQARHAHAGEWRLHHGPRV